jgi:hypothetical protein
VQGATSIDFRLSEQKLCWHWTCPKYNHCRASSIMSRSNKKLWQFNFGQSLWDNLWGAWYITIYIYIYIYIYIITTFWFLMSRTQLAISHTFSKWAPVSLQVICQSPLLELLGLSSFWLWSNFLKAFDWLQWVRFCISWWAEFYVCNFVTLFVFIC